jgi:hypothetical protein
MAKPGPKPSGVLPRRLHLTDEAMTRLDVYRATLPLRTVKVRGKAELRPPNQSQALQILLMGLPSGEPPV